MPLFTRVRGGFWMIFGLNPLGDGGRAILYRDELVLDATT
jgi:hypothetical protein